MAESLASTVLAQVLAKAVKKRNMPRKLEEKQKISKKSMENKDAVAGRLAACYEPQEDGALGGSLPASVQFGEGGCADLRGNAPRRSSKKKTITTKKLAPAPGVRDCIDL